MIKREFKARMVDDFKNAWLAACALDEEVSIAKVIDWYSDDDLQKLSERLSGQVVTLTENHYMIGTNDFFEKQDNNFVIFPSLFTEES